MSIKNRRLPTLKNFVFEKNEAPADNEAPDNEAPPPIGGDEASPEDILNQQLADIANSRNELLDQKKEATSNNDLIASATIDIDIKILDFQAQVARLEADKVRLSKEGI